MQVQERRRNEHTPLVGSTLCISRIFTENLNKRLCRVIQGH